jgi:hypothetical protein
LNPILYSFLGRRFRKDLLSAFPCIKQEQNQIISEYTQQSRATVNTTNELSLQMINSEEENKLLSVSLHPHNTLKISHFQTNETKTLPDVLPFSEKV